MFIRKLVTGIILSAAAIVPMVAHAASAPAHAAEVQPTHPPCVLEGYRVSSVAPFRIQQSAGGHYVMSRLAGAELYVPAEPGLTAEWLWLNLSRHIAAMQGPTVMKDCVLDIDKLQVEVSSAGPGFRVRLIAPDAKTGQEVLRRAQLLAT
jgi:hypothetical protein